MIDHDQQERLSTQPLKRLGIDQQKQELDIESICPKLTAAARK
ncbi:MAG: hypothetical protein ABGX90_10090 [Brachybacterium sp.]